MDARPFATIHDILRFLSLVQSLLKGGNAPIWRNREPTHIRLSGSDRLSDILKGKDIDDPADMAKPEIYRNFAIKLAQLHSIGREEMPVPFNYLTEIWPWNTNLIDQHLNQAQGSQWDGIISSQFYTREANVVPTHFEPAFRIGGATSGSELRLLPGED